MYWLNNIAPRLNFVFEIGVGYVKLINNSEPEFSHIVNKELKYDQLLLELRNCGILLCPFEEDILAVDLKVKV